ncbi:MAG: flavin reductase family protein [Acidobacteria bacterium]|nr:flavin reductase family protein [Acidobacteriota bacterium]
MAVSNQEFRAAWVASPAASGWSRHDHKGISRHHGFGVFVGLDESAARAHMYRKDDRQPSRLRRVRAVYCQYFERRTIGRSDRFAFRHEDKFSGIGFRIGEQGIPIIEGCLANLECRVVNEYSAAIILSSSARSRRSTPTTNRR